MTPKDRDTLSPLQARARGDDAQHHAHRVTEQASVGSIDLMDADDAGDGDSGGGKRDSLTSRSRRDTTKSNATSEHRMRARAQFAALFPEIKDAYDTFINSYSCAWERDILRHGRMFVTRDRVCFYSAVLAPCKLVLDYLDMRQAERRSIAGVIPNAIRITMLDGKHGGKQHTFASFMKRDAAFELIESQWNLWRSGAMSGSSPMHANPPETPRPDPLRLSISSVSSLAGCGAMSAGAMSGRVANP
ncbi:intracellular sterol transport [Polyrhizophydium stewartii]|uniref:Intracellular sterol transport n=1 Tax=Polyrhizophydium stewartii TaxID=2732419 RepID=A0ABR4NL59_9FUNG